MPTYFNRLPLWFCVVLALTVGVLSSTVDTAPAARLPRSPPGRLIGGRRTGRRGTALAPTTDSFSTESPTRSGFSGRAFHFNGQGSEVDFDAVGGNFNRDPFTIAFFIRTTSPLPQAIFNKRPVCNAESFWDFRMTGDLWGAELDGDEGTETPVSRARRSSPTETGTTSHLFATDKQHDLRGRSEPARPSRLSRSALEHRRRCGREWPVRGVDGTNPYEGDLDELMIFNRALNPVADQRPDPVSAREALGHGVTARREAPRSRTCGAPLPFSLRSGVSRIIPNG